MPIPYNERKKRRQQLAAKLPPELCDRIALRHVETVSKFSAQAKRTLAAALEAGLRAPAVIAFLKEYPQAPLAEVVQSCRTRKRATRRADGPPARDPDNAHTRLNGIEQDYTQAKVELTALLKICYPDMPGLTAEAMAGSELLAGVLDVIQAQQACLAAPQAESEFILVVLCGLARQNLALLDDLISRKPIYRQALQQSGVAWPGVPDAGRTENIRR